MKKNNKLRENLVRFFGIVTLPALLASCGSYYAYYGDGIYGELPPERVTVVEHYSNYPQQNAPAPNKYRDYFRDKAQQYSNVEEKFTHFTDVDSYSSDYYTEKEGQSYGGWGSNATQVTVNVYDNYWGSPYYGYNSFWGYGVWYPYNYGYGYYGYPYYRNRVNWGISIGWGGYYNPYWGWSGYYNPYWGYAYGGYYPYYGGYYPYYGGRYYARDYRNGYYNDRYYGRRSYDGRVYSPTTGRRGDSNRYENYNNSRNNSSSTRRTYSTPYSNSGSDSYSRSYHDNRNYAPSSNSSSRSYNNGGNYNSSRSYNEGSGGGGNRGGSGAGTTRRNY